MKSIKLSLRALRGLRGDIISLPIRGLDYHEGHEEINKHIQLLVPHVRPS